METRNTYLEFARQCERLAEKAESERHRTSLRKMAAEWRSLAETADRGK